METANESSGHIEISKDTYFKRNSKASTACSKAAIDFVGSPFIRLHGVTQLSSMFDLVNTHKRLSSTRMHIAHVRIHLGLFTRFRPPHETECFGTRNCVGPTNTATTTTNYHHSLSLFLLHGIFQISVVRRHTAHTDDRRISIISKYWNRNGIIATRWTAQTEIYSIIF